MNRLRECSMQLFNFNLNVSVMESGGGPTAEQRQQYLGVTSDSAAAVNLPPFLFPDNDQTCRAFVFRSQVLAAVSVLYTCHSIALSLLLILLL